jgi:hypothetical protein
MNITNTKKNYARMPGKALLCLIILSAYLLIPEHMLTAEEENDYNHILLLGINQPVSNSEINTPSPLLIYNYMRDDLGEDNYFQFTLKTTKALFILGKKMKIILQV